MRERASTAKKKKRIIELLLSGETPGMAAQAVGTTRAQAYVWHNNDRAFAAKWDDAVATGMDLLESTCFKRAIAGSDAMATLLLKCRRPEVFNPQAAVAQPLNDPRRDVIQLMSVSEAIEQVKQLGLPMPVLEGDFVTLDENNSSTTTARGPHDKT